MERRVFELNEREHITYLVGGNGPLVMLSYVFGSLAWGNVSRLAERCTVAVPEWLESTTDFETRSSLRWFGPFVRALGYERAALATWSLGGPPAIRFAATAPAQLSHLILVDPAGLRRGMPPLKLRDLPYFALAHLLGRPTRATRGRAGAPGCITRRSTRARWRSWTTTSSAGRARFARTAEWSETPSSAHCSTSCRR